MYVLFLLLVVGAATLILIVTICKILSYCLRSSNKLLMETSQILPKDGIESASMKVNSDDHIHTNHDSHIHNSSRNELIPDD
jgi:hypothetical protein